jgi:hypothetical protein
MADILGFFFIFLFFYFFFFSNFIFKIYYNKEKCQINPCNLVELQ